MLADDAGPITSGSLRSGLHLEGEWLDALVDFMLSELPGWRDWPRRAPESAETKLTFQLCAHLNTAAALREGMDSLGFVTEVPDAVIAGRTIDMVALPRGREIWIAARRHTHMDPLLPIECKRLPTPSPRERQEYVMTFNRRAGAMQRFKEGLHGSNFDLGVVIGYVQSKDIAHWRRRVRWWIRTLASVGVSGWTPEDIIRLDRHDRASRVAALTSVHARRPGSAPLRLRHLWLEIP